MPALALIAIVGTTIERRGDDESTIPILINPTPVVQRDVWERPLERPVAGVATVEGGAAPGEPTGAPEPLVLPDTAEPVLEPPSAPSGGDCADIARAVGISEAGLANAAIICQYPWDWWTALRVARCESGVDLYALASSGSSHGVFQLWGGHVARWPDFWEWVWDPAQNVAHAYEIWTGSGWSPWACY